MGNTEKVGPIPIEDNLGKEVIARFTTDMNTQNMLWTDSEGNPRNTPNHRTNSH
jgi:lysosomal alpha-mannosidase